jgi:transposase
MKDTFDLPGLDAISDSFDETNNTHLIIAKIPLKEAEACPFCREAQSIRRFGSRSSRYRDIPLGGHRVVITLDIPRYRCLSCAKVFSQMIQGMDRKRYMTTRCVEWIRQQVILNSFSGVARTVGCSERIVRSVASEHTDDMNNVYARP